ncbi:MAG: hypothetical protein QW197_01965 [Candidatus Aenigmatarchaeota archaeon]
MEQSTIKTIIFIVIAILIILLFIAIGYYYIKVLSTQTTIK